jgi:hypothetical protein
MLVKVNSDGISIYIRELAGCIFAGKYVIRYEVLADILLSIAAIVI